MSFSIAADKLLRDLTAAREALRADGHSLSGTAFDQRIAELAELAPRIICPECGGRARGCATCAVKNSAGERVSLGIVCPGCAGGHFVRKIGESYYLPGDVTVPKLVACRFCMTYDADAQGHVMSAAKLIRAIEAELIDAQHRRRDALAALEDWQ